MTTHDRFTMRYWGVRGSIPAPGMSTARYGGNTSCIEIRCGDRLLVIDAGTGLRSLGQTLVQPASVAMFFTHMHWDHIQGVPFFAPIYRPGFQFEVYAPRMEGITARDVLVTQMSYPMFPVEFSSLPSAWTFRELLPDTNIDLGDGVRVETRALNHPGGSIGLRVHYRGRSVVHCSDTEHYADRFDENVLSLCRGADYVNYDASYCHDEYMGISGPSRVGWGHSTWQEGVRVAQEAEVGTLVLFHHDHTHDDDRLDAIHALARREFPNTIMAIEGREIDVLAGQVRTAR